jgi:hypothetical protein
MNKKLLVAFAAVAISLSLPASAQKPKSYGKAFKSSSVKTPQTLLQSLNGKTAINNVAVEGEISQVCQAEGCWMKLKNASGEDIMVKFKDHSFFVPKDIAGKTAIVYGNASKKSISVEERKHMAEDAGAGQADIDAITEPKDEIRIDATGVVVR